MAETDAKTERRPVDWRTVAILVAFGSPLWYFATDIMPPPRDAPTVTSPEGRAILRAFLDSFLPQTDKITSFKGVPQ